MQEEHQHLPNTDRLSVIAASILLAYALLPFIKIPERALSVQIVGALFELKVNFSTIIAIISSGMAAAGISWLLRDHPHFNRAVSPRPAVSTPALENASLPLTLRPRTRPRFLGVDLGRPASLALGEMLRAGASFPENTRAIFQHWMLPALTAWVIGVPLNSLVVGLQWWAVFSLGGLLLVLVMVAEYIAVDPNDTRYGPAAVGLTAVSYALFLILAIALAAARTRLYILVPALTGAIFLVTVRNLYLRLSGRWCISWSIGIALMIGQVTAALHYWTLTPLRFGLIILGLAYALASLVGSFEEGRPWRSSWFEPAIMLAVLWGLAIMLRG
jgi:hypothetical protein